MKYLLPEGNGGCYIKQPRFRYCGQCQITTLLRWMGRQDESVHFKENSPSWFAKVSGFIWPGGFKKVFRKYDIPITIQKAKQVKQNEKIIQIEDMIKQKQRPLILLIAHGYDGVRKKKDIFRMLTMQHYISIRGFDDAKEIFYIYDSTLSIKNPMVPIGNYALSYDDLLYYWKRSGWGLYNYIYIVPAKNVS